MHEDPQVPNFVSRGLRGSGDFRLEPGLVIAVEPMVNMGTKQVKMHRDHWTQVDAGRQAQRPLRAHDRHDRTTGPCVLTEAPTPDRSWTSLAIVSRAAREGSRLADLRAIRRQCASAWPLYPSPKKLLPAALEGFGR